MQFQSVSDEKSIIIRRELKYFLIKINRRITKWEKYYFSPVAKEFLPLCNVENFSKCLSRLIVNWLLKNYFPKTIVSIEHHYELCKCAIVLGLLLSIIATKSVNSKIVRNWRCYIPIVNSLEIVSRFYVFNDRLSSEFCAKL